MMITAFYFCYAHGVAELDGEVILELEVPFWIEAEDITVDIDDTGLHLSVRSHFDVKRRFWVDNE